MARYCKFLHDINEDKELNLIRWHEGDEVKIIWENKDIYYFGEPKIKSGIQKKYEDELFIIDEKDE